jgi:hypothetical protein
MNMRSSRILYNFYYIVSYDRFIVADGLRNIWKETVPTKSSFDILTGGTEENH